MTEPPSANTEKASFASAESLAEMPGHLLRRCHQIAVAIFLDERHEGDLTPLQFATLTALATHGALDKSTLGGAIALDRTTISVVVKNLDHRGLVTSRASLADRRAKLIEITPAGLDLLVSAQRDVERSQARILAPLTQDERQDLMRLLGKMADANNLLSRAPRRAPRRSGR